MLRSDTLKKLYMYDVNLVKDKGTIMLERERERALLGLILCIWALADVATFHFAKCIYDVI